MTFILTAFLALSAWADINPVAKVLLFNDRTTTGYSSTAQPFDGIKTFQATCATSSGAGAATVIIYGGNVDSSVATDWPALCTISLVLSATSIGDACVSDSNYLYYRARVSAISGTNAACDVLMGSRVQ